jgi:hypothetical protein
MELRFLGAATTVTGSPFLLTTSRAKVRVFGVHGDPDARAAIAPKIRALGFDTHIPKWHERVTLD